MGGKHDDIAISVAQIFTSGTPYPKKSVDEPFKNLITVYTQSPKHEESHEMIHKKTNSWDEL